MEPDGRPFGVASFDGKGTAIPFSDDWYAQRQTQTDDGLLLGVVRTVTVTLTSSQFGGTAQNGPYTNGGPCSAA